MRRITHPAAIHVDGQVDVHPDGQVDVHPDGQTREGVLLELGSRGGTHPAGPHRYRSMVADYAITDLGEPEDTWEEFANFAVNVLAPERTLLEKIAVFSLAARKTRERCRRGL